MLNLILIICILVLTGILVAGLFQKADLDLESTEEDPYTLDYCVKIVRYNFNLLRKLDVNALMLNPVASKKVEETKVTLQKSLKTCAQGDIGSKEYVKDRVREYLIKFVGVTEENINRYIPFDSPGALPADVKFLILMYVYKKKYSFDAFSRWVKDFDLCRERIDPKTNGVYYEIDKYDVNRSYKVINPELTFNDKLNVLAQLIYQMGWGDGWIDELRDMMIDGVSGGVSGIPAGMFVYGTDLSFNEEDPSMPLSSDNSIWCMFGGRNVRLSFLGFKSEKELIRVAKLVYRYNNPGQLSQERGFIANFMYDGSRVVAARPDFAESWMFFIRKFGSSADLDINDIIPGDNADLFIQMVKWIVAGYLSMVITGGQGSGKTETLRHITDFISRTKNICVNEKMSELMLRKLYPNRNITSLQETDTISIQEGMDISKKMDRSVSIMGEAAEQPDCAKVVQLARCGFDSVYCTNHSASTKAMVYYFRDAISNTGGGSNLQVIEANVAEALNFNYRQVKEDIVRPGMPVRHPAFLEEVIPKAGDPYPDDLEDAMKEYFLRMTDRPIFDVNRIVEWNPEIGEHGGYEYPNMPSKRVQKIIMDNISKEQRVEFRQFLSELQVQVNLYKKKHKEA